MSWRVARSLDVLLEQLNTLAPLRNKASDGSIGDAAHASRKSDHNPDEGGVVRARDFTHDPTGGLDCHLLAESLARARDRRVKYVIWNRRIMSATLEPWRWRPYTGSNPHVKHLHLSVVEGARGDDSSSWVLALKTRPLWRTKSWDGLPPHVQRRWGPMRVLAERCFAKGMEVQVFRGESVDVDGAWPKALWSGPAVFVPYLRVLAMVEGVALGTDASYGRFRGDVHELGHAVWYLLLTTWERWTKYLRLYVRARLAGKLIAYGGEVSPKIEEAWAQDFEAFWTTEEVDWVGKDRIWLRANDFARYEFMAYTLRRLGADVDRTLPS